MSVKEGYEIWHVTYAYFFEEMLLRRHFRSFWINKKIEFIELSSYFDMIISNQFL